MVIEKSVVCPQFVITLLLGSARKYENMKSIKTITMVRFANLDFDISRFFYEKDLDSFVWFESGKESFIFKAMSQYFINWGHQNVSGSKSGS